MSDILNVPLGVCDVYVGGRHVGHTIGGVEVHYAPEFHETKVDAYAGVAERWLVGEDLYATVPMAELTIANIKEAITHANSAAGYVSVGSKAGKRSSTAAETVRLHPIANAAGDLSDDVTIYKAHVTNEITLPYKNDGETIIEAEFHGLVDESRVDGNLLGLIGSSV